MLFDASGLRGDTKIEKLRYKINSDTFVELSVTSSTQEPINNGRYGDGSISFKLQFWKGKDTIFRVDNAHGFLHFHDDKVDHVKIDETQRISQVIGFAFDEAKSRLKAKGIKFEEGAGFVGTA